MNKAVLHSVFVLLVVCSTDPVFGTGLCDTHPDPENHVWSVAWTDAFGQTTYSLAAPCKVYAGMPFMVSVAVVDIAYPAAAVAWNWAIRDTPEGETISTVAGGGSDWIWLDDDGKWTHEVEVTYTGRVANHAIEFSFTDFGHGSGTHGLEGHVIGDVTVGQH